MTSIERNSAGDFVDPTLEWRRIFAEVWGTFLLVLVAAGGGVVAATSGGRVTLGMIAVAPGMMVMAIIYFMGSVSGAHLNPAVTLAFAVRGNFPWRRVPGYVAGQLLGGAGAATFLRLMFGTVGALGATTPGSGVTDGRAFAMEVILTAALVNTILGTASGARNIGANGAIAVGGYIALAGLWAAPISGASMNPVRSLAPDLLRGDLHTTWIYVIGPLAGALIGVAFEFILRGKPTVAGGIAARGTLAADDRAAAARSLGAPIDAVAWKRSEQNGMRSSASLSRRTDLARSVALDAAPTRRRVAHSNRPTRRVAAK